MSHHKTHKRELSGGSRGVGGEGEGETERGRKRGRERGEATDSRLYLRFFKQS